MSSKEIDGGLMGLDTAALRALADYVETLPPFTDFDGTAYPYVAQIEVATLRALCDGYDEAARLRESYGAASYRTSELTVERDAARQALAALVADLRALCDDNQGLYAYAEQGLVDAVECHRIRAVIDRYAPATPTTEEDR